MALDIVKQDNTVIPQPPADAPIQFFDLKAQQARTQGSKWGNPNISRRLWSVLRGVWG